MNAPALSEKAGKATTVAEGAFNQAKPSLTNSLTSLSSRDPGTLAEYALGAAVVFYLVCVSAQSNAHGVCNKLNARRFWEDCCYYNTRQGLIYCFELTVTSQSVTETKTGHPLGFLKLWCYV